MRACSVVVLTIFLLVSPVSLNSATAQRRPQSSRESKIPAEIARLEIFDVAPMPVDDAARQMRLEKNRRYNSRMPFKLADRPGEYTTIIEDYIHPVDALPFAISELVVLGTVETIQPYLSEDETTLYTEYAIRAGEIFKNATGRSVGAGDLVEVDGRAGALRLPSGKVLRVAMHGQDQLRTKATYVIFAVSIHDGRDLLIRCAYQLTGNSVLPLSREFGSEYANMDQGTFLRTLRTRSSEK